MKFTKVLSLIASILVIVSVSALQLKLGLAYYYIIGSILLFILLKRTQYKFNPILIWIICAAFLSIFLNQVPSFFRPYERLFGFVIILSLTSPLIYSTVFQQFRLYAFKRINFILIIMAVGTFFGLVTGIYVGRDDMQFFTGLYSHSMILGPMAGIAIINSIFGIYNSKIKIIRILYIVAASLSFISCVASGSRAAIGGTAIGLMFFFYRIYKGSLTKVMRTVLILVCLITVSFPLWENQTQGIMSKIYYAQDHGDMAETRREIWFDRVLEFSTSPIYGVGFGSVDTRISKNYETEGGKIEPGSSWLAVLSMTGLIGFIPIIILIYTNVKFLIKENDSTTQSAYMGALLITIILHMFAEGYIFSSGSGMAYYFWLLIGNIDIKKNTIITNKNSFQKYEITNNRGNL